MTDFDRELEEEFENCSRARKLVVEKMARLGDFCAVYAELNNELGVILDKLDEENFEENYGDKFVILNIAMKDWQEKLARKLMYRSGWETSLYSGDWEKVSEMANDFGLCATYAELDNEWGAILNKLDEENFEENYGDKIAQLDIAKDELEEKMARKLMLSTGWELDSRGKYTKASE